MKAGIERDIKTIDDGFALVDEAHDASHFAKTGKNPESSRGHTVYILKLKIRNPEGEDYDPITTEFWWLTWQDQRVEALWMHCRMDLIKLVVFWRVV
eukprot:UN02502